MRTLRLLVIVLLAAACRQEQEPRFAIIGADPEQGRRLVQAAGCGACHMIPGVSGARGLVGPPLEEFANRAYIGGQLANTPDPLVRWLLDPPAFDSATAMPPSPFTVGQARNVAAYLYTLGDARPLGPPHLLPKDWVQSW